MNLERKYLCLKNIKYEFENYSLVTIREKDIESIRKWRNNQIDVLRQKEKISKKEQIQYYKSFIIKNFKKKNPDSILFSYMLNEKCIGYGGLTNIDWDLKRAELSFLVDDHRYFDSKIYAKDFFAFLKHFCGIEFFDFIHAINDTSVSIPSSFVKYLKHLEGAMDSAPLQRAKPTRRSLEDFKKSK